jgi:pyruvate-formate lyase
MNEYTFASRLKALREKKEQQTQEKLRKNGYMDEDDYGSVLPPEDFQFEPEFNDPVHQTFYGAELWGRNFRRLMEVHPVYVDVNDALAGRWMFILQRLRPFESATSVNNLEMAPVFNYAHLKPTQEKYDLLPGIGKMHHFAGDYRIGLSLGWGGLLEKVNQYQSTCSDEEAMELYGAERDVLEGIHNWISRTIEAIRQMEARESNPLKRQNLTQMRQANEWILDHPARTLREACQWIAWYNMAERTYCRAGAGCQLDQVLRPYYEADKEKGQSDEEAKFIIACLLLSDPHYYQVGGPDRDGKDNTNPLSFLILEAMHELKVSANITIRVFDGMDERLFQRGLEILFEDKKAYPRFSGDKALVAGFMRNGYSAELARERIALGCNWMSLAGLEYTLNDLIKVNMAKVFEVAFLEYDGQKTEELFQLFTAHLQKAIDCLREGIDFHFKHQYKNAPELLLNLISYGPIEKGRDASHGSMQYYNIAIDGAGLATAADSFAALEEKVEREKKLSWDECRRVLRNNYEGPEGARSKAVLSSASRYGYGGTCADRWAKRISDDFTHCVADRRTPDGYLTIPGLFSWANTVSFGHAVGATPNGRRSGEPISHGANPNPGFRKDGAFSAMAKAIARVQPGYGNTAPFQLELNPMITNREQAVENVGAVIKTHFDLGGTLVNVNIVDAEQIRAADKNPELFPNLIVRVTGFSAYFSTLSPEFRKLIVDRVVNDQ